MVFIHRDRRDHGQIDVLCFEIYFHSKEEEEKIEEMLHIQKEDDFSALH